MARVIIAHYLQRRGAEVTGTNETVRDTAAHTGSITCTGWCHVLCDVLCVVCDVLCVMCYKLYVICYVLYVMCYVLCVMCYV